MNQVFPNCHKALTVLVVQFHCSMDCKNWRVFTFLLFAFILKLHIWFLFSNQGFLLFWSTVKRLLQRQEKCWTWKRSTQGFNVRCTKRRWKMWICFTSTDITWFQQRAWIPTQTSTEETDYLIWYCKSVYFMDWETVCACMSNIVDKNSVLSFSDLKSGLYSKQFPNFTFLFFWDQRYSGL